ncbi:MULTISPECIES: ATP-dependent DNA ligase [Sulfurisphaera]|uniref:DNA ligase n=3 Tax=Sulfurisphaera TaxID=69655 RepID=DNLI_SULTO|nr:MULTISPECIES: ATP-dependent DNA ligase [Sulfurisphaera]Q976G4.1 RecName: Full=DNA ligase; AltName: Full=Polydeoxyribonucleotide synthase [ATP] [Sulfurisphaera tokodaii str. 7]MBB5253233.1 DNA ligase-1 [Sulfurisphaera ohwakuensis]QGR15860.1 ATP-dependent DNA ligase [Sulfurisphaera ohwakuensis]BAB65183.1 DNA ligase [Sulfurisphaera tokodaii str. 7]HII74345.1 ATP-dependent DNA ligase [Sulfurisphaera tokodaii]
MEFKLIAEYFDKLEKISSRLQLTALLTDLFKKADKNVIDKVVYLIQGKLWPDFLGYPELGVGEKLLIKAISIAVNVKEEVVEEQLKVVGDLGEVAMRLKKTPQSASILSFLGAQSNEGLTVEETYESLTKIALASGEGSRDIKIRSLAGLLKKASPLEAKYIVRFVDGRLRVGIGDATIMDALSTAFTGSTSFRPLIERAYNLRADLGNIAKIIAQQGVEALKDIKPQVGIPIRPMLAERMSDPAEILAKVGGEALVDYKYDGERAQIHKKDKEVYIFSRRLENITRMYPDVVEYVREYINANEVIIEGEIVAVDPESNEIRPFQELMHRKRKNDINEAIKEYPVNVYLFDLMLYEDADYTMKPLPERRKKLEEVIKPNDKLHIAHHIYTNNVDKLMEFFYDAISNGAEGVMVKSVAKDSIYQAGSRGFLWIKLKRDYQSEMADSVDLVVVGAFYGRGKRGGKLSSLLMAAYDPETDTFKTVCKVASGFSDAELDELQKKLMEIKLDKKDPRVDSQLEPDIWVEPKYVAEIIGAEITLSPEHTCCKDMVSKGAGLSVRFPRFIRWRDDKSIEDATTPKEIYEMYKMKLRKKEEEQHTDEA